MRAVIHMRYRTFGRTGLSVSTVSMGTNRLGDPGVDPTIWPPLVERALELRLRLGRIEQLRFLERPGQTLGQAALRFVLAHPAVHCVVPGRAEGRW
jgi:aryl-alcohol dehydrogenase-like predicted oxidoreductase